MRPFLQVLSKGLITRILDEAMEIMSGAGMDIRGRELRRRLLDHGLAEDRSGKRILFPRAVVEEAIASCPGSITLYDRDGAAHAELADDNVHFVPGSSGLKIQDHRSGKTRPANSTDFVEYVRLCDGLEHIAYLATAFSTNEDIESQVSDAWRLYLCLTNSRKPLVSGAFTASGVPRMAEMMCLFRNDRKDLISRPLSIFTITAAGNFRYGEDSCQNLLDCVEWGIPVEIVPVTLMGLIAPVTPVGALVFHCVDVLTGVTMAQIIRPGAPVLFGGAPAAFHMQAATSPMAAIEALRLDAAYVQIAKYLGLPTQSYMALSDSKFLDAQAGAESFAGALLAALAGVNSVSGPGMLDYVLVFSLPKLVFDNDMCGQALHFIRAIEPADDLPSRHLLDAVQQEDHLLTAEHTLQHWPDHLYLPSGVVDRDNRENWRKKGAPELQQRALVEVQERLARYEPVTTETAIDTELRSMISTGLRSQTVLPAVPPAEAAATATPRTRRRSRRAR